jgi:chaperonin cofactor prefoldin
MDQEKREMIETTIAVLELAMEMVDTQIDRLTAQRDGARRRLGELKAELGVAAPCSASVQ